MTKIEKVANFRVECGHEYFTTESYFILKMCLSGRRVFLSLFFIEAFLIVFFLFCSSLLNQLQ